MCWVAADRGARLAELRNEEGLAARWRTAAEEIREDVLAHGVDKRGVLTQYYGGDALDASVLLAVLFGFLPPDDERLRATIFAIAEELTVDGLVLRYRVEETDDGLQGEEGIFTLCSFWLVSAFTMIGELQRGPTTVRATALRRRARSSCTARRSTRRPDAISATFRRHSRTSR